MRRQPRAKVEICTAYALKIKRIDAIMRFNGNDDHDWALLTQKFDVEEEDVDEVRHSSFKNASYGDCVKPYDSYTNPHFDFYGGPLAHAFEAAAAKVLGEGHDISIVLMEDFNTYRPSPEDHEDFPVYAMYLVHKPTMLARA